VIDAGDGAPRVEQPGGERAVVRQHEEPGRSEVEPPHGIEANAGAGDEVAHRRTALGIGERAHHAARLVQDDRTPRGRGPHPLAVERDLVARGIGACPELAHDGSVDAHPPREDERLRMTPGGDAGGTQYLL
jgi:hypothetical protein